MISKESVEQCVQDQLCEFGSQLFTHIAWNTALCVCFGGSFSREWCMLAGAVTNML